MKFPTPCESDEHLQLKGESAPSHRPPNDMTRRASAATARRRRLRPKRPICDEQAPPPPRPPSELPSHHVCYALHLPTDPRGRTYVGYTVDPARRLRQHNGELCGGARATKRVQTPGCWRHLFVVVVERGDGDFGSHEALSLEWHLKRGRGGGAPSPRGRKKGARSRRSHACTRAPTPAPTRGVARRFELLREALCLPKFERFRDRFVVFVDDAHVDAAFAALIDTPGLLCCVLPLGELLLHPPRVIT